MIAAGRPNTSPDGISITGIAPKAFLGNYKIYGSPGVNDYTFGSAILAALEDAFLDGMDVVSLSFGSSAVYGPLDRGAACGSTDPTFVCDIRADAVENAVAKGMAVVVSAGNDADLGFKYPDLQRHLHAGHGPFGHHRRRQHQFPRFLQQPAASRRRRAAEPPARERPARRWCDPRLRGDWLRCEMWLPSTPTVWLARR